MLEQRIRHLTVVDEEQRLVGLLSEHSLIRPSSSILSMK